jgi:hypothetical protein
MTVAQGGAVLLGMAVNVNPIAAVMVKLSDDPITAVIVKLSLGQGQVHTGLEVTEAGLWV